MMELPNYSVLMSVYRNEKAEYLETAMNSIWEQTIPTDDFVLICDGPLSAELNHVINENEKSHPELTVIRLEKNQGLGHALKTGVYACRNELIARMDSDDISKKDRCEKEVRYLSAHPEISVCGSNIDEFTTVKEGSRIPDEIISTRFVPENEEDIASFAKKRNPFNHPSVMIRKTDVLAAGNYQEVRYLQDYYLWIEMLLAGFKGHNIQESLVWMRVDSNLFMRRSGKLYRDIQVNLFKHMKEEGFISKRQYLSSCAVRIGSSMAPNWLRQFLFRKILRKAG